MGEVLEVQKEGKVDGKAQVKVLVWIYVKFLYDCFIDTYWRGTDGEMIQGMPYIID